MNKRDQILALRLQNPFVPFRMKLKNGSAIDLTEPLMFAVGQNVVLIAREIGGHTKVRIEDIVSVDSLEPIA